MFTQITRVAVSDVDISYCILPESETLHGPLLSLCNLTAAAQRIDLTETCLVIDCMSLADVHP